MRYETSQRALTDPDLELVTKVLAGARRSARDPDITLVAMLAELSASDDPEAAKDELLRKLATDARSNTH